VSASRSEIVPSTATASLVDVTVIVAALAAGAATSASAAARTNAMQHRLGCSTATGRHYPSHNYV
jgi:hypothetical protein